MLTQPVSQEISTEIETMTEEVTEEEIVITEEKTTEEEVMIGEIEIEIVIIARNKKAEVEAEVEVGTRREDKRIEEVHHHPPTAVDYFDPIHPNLYHYIKTTAGWGMWKL